MFRKHQDVQQQIKKNCLLCKENIKELDWEELELLKKFVSPQGRILASRKTGTCSKHQRKIAKAVKRARILGLIPFHERK